MALKFAFLFLLLSACANNSQLISHCSEKSKVEARFNSINQMNNDDYSKYLEMDSLCILESTDKERGKKSSERVSGSLGLIIGSFLGDLF